MLIAWHDLWRPASVVLSRARKQPGVQHARLDAAGTARLAVIAKHFNCYPGRTSSKQLRQRACSARASPSQVPCTQYAKRLKNSVARRHHQRKVDLKSFFVKNF